MTVRLPKPGLDDGTWGGILNAFLQVAHNADGTLQTAAIEQAGGLTNVSLTSPSDNQVIAFDAISGKWTNQTNSSAPVASVFGRTGAVAAQSGDYTAAQVGAVSLGATAGGDLSGTYPNPTVAKVGGKTVGVSGVVNLADYGLQAAAGTALNAAIAALGSSGGTINIPAGSWIIDTGVLINKNGVTLQGVGPASILAFNGGSVSTMLAMADTTQRFFNMRDLKIVQTGTAGTGVAIDASYFVNSTFERLRIGDGQNPNMGIKFNAQGSYYNVIRDCRITAYGAGSACVYFNTVSNSNIVQNCRLLGDANTTGIYANCNGIIIDHVDMESAALIGIHLDTQAFNCTIINPYLESLATGVQLESGCGWITIINGDLGGCTSPITDNGANGLRWENTWAWSTSLPNSTMSSSTTATQLWGVKESADTNARLAVNSAGTMTFGPGNAAGDVTFSRVGTQTMQVSGSFDVSINERIQDNLTVGKLSSIGSGGAGVVEIFGNVAPTANPSGGAALYYGGGALKYLDPAGNTWNLNALSSAGVLSSSSAVIPTVSGSTSASGNLQFGSTTSTTKGQVKFGSGAAYDETSGSFQFGSSTPSLGGGAGVLGIANVTTVPTSNPSGGGILYASSGLPTWRDPGGNVYNLANGGSSAPTVPLANDYGLTAWTYDFINSSSTTTMVLGTVYLAAVMLRSAATISKLWWIFGTAGATPTTSESWVGLYNSSGTLQGTANIDNKIALNGPQSAAVGPLSLSSGMYWVAITANAATMPTLARSSATLFSSNNVNQTAATYRFAVNGTGATTLASSITPTTNTLTGGIAFWAALS